MEVKQNKAITLIALIVTIIILLILAGVTIATLTGENGLLSNSQNAKETATKAQLKEEIQTAIMNIQTEEIAKGNNVTLETLKDKLPSKLNITAELSDNEIKGKYKGYDYKIESNFNIAIEDGTQENEILYKNGLEYAYDMKTYGNSIEYGARFTGSSYLQTEDIGTEYTGTNSKTLTAWFKTTVINSSIIGFSGIGNEGSGTGFLCGVKNGCLYFDTGALVLDISHTSYFVSDGKWHFFAATYDKDTTTMTIYLDGEEIHKEQGTINTTNAPLTIGKSFAYTFNGEISRVSLYNRAITSAEVTQLHNLGSGNYSTATVSNGSTYEYIMKNNSDGIVEDTANSHIITSTGDVNYYEEVLLKDISENNNDLNVNNKLLKNSDGRYYLDFENTSEYYQTKTLGEEYLEANSKTLMVWFKTAEVSSTISGFAGIGLDGVRTGFLCGVQNGYLYFDTGSYNFLRAGQDYVADSQWHHFVASYEQETQQMKLYLDGKMIYEEVGDLNTSSAPLIIGKSFGYLFNGQVSGVKLYNIAVDGEIITQIYNTEK